MKNLFTLCLCLFCLFANAQNADSVMIRKLFDESLARGKSYEWLRYLTKQVGPRLSGSANGQKAVDWAKQVMEKEKFDRVFVQDVMVPHWVRGVKEEAYFNVGKQKMTVPILALGGSVATPPQGIDAGVIEVTTFQQLRVMDPARVKGKIVFFNRPMDPTKINTFEAYSGAVDQRANGVNEAAKLGAVGVIVRSMTNVHDDNPHTGGLRYATGVPLIPGAAISTNGADRLSEALRQNPALTFYFKQNCETLPDAKSYNVIGELRGTSNPDEIIIVGGHLDSWDVAEGAHDDGTGVYSRWRYCG